MNRYIAFIALLLWTSISFPSKAHRFSFDVPTEMQFADMRILFDAEAREIIQGRVDNFVKAGYYNNCILRAKMYFPLIEQALTRQHTPTDLKYLSLLSSYVIPSSQAPDGSVGLWLMTDSLARQLGLTVNNEVDERMHVILSSESMAKHLAEKNYILRNWIYTMMSYRMEIVDVMNEFDRSLIGANQLLITSKTHNSILNLLAYVIAYKEKIDAPPPHKLDLLVYNNAQGKSLKEIASFTKLPYEQVKNFNKWLIIDKVPAYKHFSVLLPVPKPRKNEVNLLIQSSEKLSQSTAFDTTKYPLITNKTDRRYRDKSYIFVSANGLNAMIAGEGDRTADMADAADLDLDKFREFNDMSKYDDVKQGQVYYLQKKNKKTEVKEHILEAGESFWDVSQRYGVRISALIINNRLSEKDTAKVGRVVWLKEKRPENVPVEYRQVAQNSIFTQPDSEISGTPTANTNTKKVDDISPKNNTPTNDTSKDNDSIYVVKANETIIDVYRKTNVPFDELVKINDLKTPNVYEGQQIRLKPYTNVKVGVVANADPNFVPPTVDEVANPAMTVTTADDSLGKVQENLEEHIVKKGETLSAIAGKYKISVPDLKKWNGLNEKADIKVGQKLRLKAPTLSAKTDDLPKTDTTDVMHTVIAKESLWGIAKKYGVTQEDITKINQLDEKGGIKIGQKLTIKRRTAPKSQMGSETQTSDKQTQTVGQTPTGTDGQGGTQTTTQIDNQKIISEIGTNDLVKISMAYVVNPPSSGDDIIEINPAVDHFANIRRRYYLDHDDLAKWNGIALQDVIEGSIPSDRRTLVVTQKGYNMSLQSGNVIYPKQVESVTPTNNQQSPNNNQQPINNNQQPANNNQQQPPQMGNNTANNAGSGETKKIPVNAFFDNFFTIKEKYALTDEDIARLNPSINMEAIKSGSIPPEVTELVVAGNGGSSAQDPIDNTGTGTQNSYVEPTTTTGTTSDQHIIHKVAYGDNLYKISKKYDVHTDSIHKWNNIPDHGEIDKGHELIVGKKSGVSNPAASSVTTPNTTTQATTPVANNDIPPFHILKKGETMYGLSKTYNVPLKDLIEYNPKIFKDNMIRNGDTVHLKRPESKGTISKASLSSDEGYYTVQDGDDMYKICEKFKIKPSDLKIWNKLAPGVGVTKPITIGTKLVVDADLADKLKNKSGIPTSNFYDEPIYHFVQKGETLSSIAKKYNTDADELKATNNKQDGNLHEGEKLLVGKIYYHVVEKGETLTAIAQKYKISNEKLKALNNKKDDVLKNGEKLIVGK
ncbi:MAG: LysM peptidoglycan-binding domain-containing protein [Cytophagales bacterium]|nr:MAG: LysM peptidoglycan-binding domain-containing protein [Cytophagales bacterium]